MTVMAPNRFGPDLGFRRITHRPRLLDLFCGAGGAGMGYYRSGVFDITGVDIEPQPNYPFAFIQADVMALDPRLLRSFDAIHASPPCQRYCAPAQYNGNREDYPDLVEPVRAMLKASGRPYIIENVPGAPLLDPIVLCGANFAGSGLRVYRHRLFESNIALQAPEHRPHHARCARNGVIPPEGGFFTITGGKHSKAWVKAAAKAMGVEWMTGLREVCEAIPPAYTHYLAAWLSHAFVAEQLSERAA